MSLVLQKIEKKQILNVFGRIFKDAEGNALKDEKKINEFSDRAKALKIGDLVKISYKILEGKKERIQLFEGNIIAMKGKGLTRTIKVRKFSYGIGVERTLPVFSPNVANIEVLKHGKVRRAKLYYLRDRGGKSAIIKEKINFKKIEAAEKIKNKARKDKTEAAKTDAVSKEAAAPKA